MNNTNKQGEIQVGDLVVFIRDFEIPRKLGVVRLAPVVVLAGSGGLVVGVQPPLVGGNLSDTTAAQIQLNIPLLGNIWGVWLPETDFDAVQILPKLNKLAVEYPIGAKYQSTQEDKIFEVLEHGVFALKVSHLGWVSACEFAWWISSGLIVEKGGDRHE